MDDEVTMASRRYRYWTLDELKDAVKALEESRSAGAKSVSYVGGGTVFYVSREEFNAEINALYDEIDAREGRKAVRVGRVVMRP